MIHINLTQLKYFRAICTYQTVSSAAEFLHISQPSLSNAIKELESEFGTTLFIRRHKGMVPTAEAEILLKMCDDILNRADTIEHVMHDLGKDRKTLRLGVPPMIGSLILPHILRDFLSKHPEIKLEITEGGRTELQKSLSSDSLDMVFLPHNRALGTDFDTQKITRLEIVCCVSREHALASKEIISANMLTDTPLILFKDGFYQTEEIKRWFSLCNAAPNILMQTAQLSTILTVISHNAAAGFLFRQLIEENTELIPLALETPIYVDVSLVSKRGSYISGSMKKFREFIDKNNLFKKDI